MLEKRRLGHVLLNLAGKALLSLALSASVALVALPERADAQLAQGQKIVNQTAQTAGIPTATDLPTMIGRIIYIALGTVGFIFLVLLLYSGFQYMTANGNPEKIKSAVARIRNAVIGLLIIAFSFAIVNFILGWLVGDQSIWGSNSGNGSGSGFNIWDNSGGLGNASIIEYHYPEPGQLGVPRNTAIVVTFIPQIDPASFIAGWTVGNPMSGNLNETNLDIHPEANKDAQLASDKALVAVSEDLHTVMIKPVEPLGNAQKPTWYEVALGSGIQNASGTKIFGGSFSEGYVWRFQVSTQLDNSPPQVQSIVPTAGGLYDRNIVVQVNFNEPMFPGSVAGIYDNAGFQNMKMFASADGQDPIQLSGEYRISNGYRTVEFLSKDKCGMNSCLIELRCLPALKTIKGEIKAASLLNNESALAAGFKVGKFDGAVDMAFNSLDGDSDGKATGPVGDPAGGMDDWPAATTKNPISFMTSDQINRDPPFIKRVDPGVNADQIPFDKNVDVDWLSDPGNINGVLMAYSVNAKSFRIHANGPQEKDPNNWWFYTKMENLDDNGEVATSTTDHMQTRATIYHRPFVKSEIPTKEGENTNNYYNPYVRHFVMNIYQNCYNPAAYVDANKTKTKATDPLKPNFCNNIATGGTFCPFIQP